MNKENSKSIHFKCRFCGVVFLNRVSKMNHVRKHKLIRFFNSVNVTVPLTVSEEMYRRSRQVTNESEATIQINSDD